MKRRSKWMVDVCNKRSREDSGESLKKDDEIRRDVMKLMRDLVGSVCDITNPRITGLFAKSPEEVLGPVVKNETQISTRFIRDYNQNIGQVSSLFDRAPTEQKTYYELKNVDFSAAALANVAQAPYGENCQSPKNIDPFDSDDSVKDPNYEHNDETDSDSSAEVERQRQTVGLPEEGNLSNRGQSTSSKTAAKRERKMLKNCGQAYVTKKGKKVDQRQSRPLKNTCRRKCSEKISDDVRLALFKDHWDIGDYDKRVMFLSSLIRIDGKKTATMYKTTANPKNREKTISYFIDLKRELVQICQVCFLNIFGETPKFIRSVISKKSLSESGIPPSDERGKHEPPHKISEERRQKVIDHILKFPSYESHYSRRHTSKRYSPTDLNKTKMYGLYCAETQDPVCLKVYSEMVESLNLKFKKPRNDTCNTCDTFRMKIQCSKDQEIKFQNEEQLENHHIEAETAYSAKKNDKALAGNSSNIKVISFDLQQVLPTPYLTTGTVFYKRQLHTYNLTIHDCSTNHSTHFMWHEAVAGRGANEIASCLYKYLTDLDGAIDHVICYSDTCGGQNKNSHVTAMMTYLVAVHEKLRIVDHTFLIPGHTHMECDSDHAIIEKYKKKSPFPIHVPRDWLNLVRMAGQSSGKNMGRNRFTVVQMTNKDFLEFSQLLRGPLIAKKLTEDKQKFMWTAQKWIRYEKEFGMVKFKECLSEEVEFKSVNFKRKSSGIPPLDIKLNRILEGSRPIDQKKKKDLLEMLNLIDEEARDFYRNLRVSSQDPKDVDPDLDLGESDQEF